MMSRRRWLGGWGLMAGTYLVLGTIHLAGSDSRSAMVYLVAAAITFGFAAAILPLMAPRREAGEDGPAGGTEPPDGEPPPPPWWPEFEREFWSRVPAGNGRSAEDREAPAGPGRETREHTPA